MTTGQPAATFAFTPLTPTSFLRRSAVVFRDRLAIVDGERRMTYGEFAQRSLALTGLLADLGVAPGDRVAALCANSHVMLEMHNGVPLCGAVLVPLNIRLAPEELRRILDHCGARVLVTTADLAGRARSATSGGGIRVVVAGEEQDEYESLLGRSQPNVVECADERGLLAINYTSGTTGGPKGVMYHHRGAYLQSLAMAFHTRLRSNSRYLWTLPMFHCNGWSFTWAVTAAGGTHVCLRSVDPARIWRLIRTEGIIHYSAAPTVLTMIANDPAALDGPLPDPPIHVDTGGAPPSPSLLSTMAGLRMDVTHLYGLTETFGPIVINEWQAAWDERPDEEKSMLRARQGVGNVVASPIRVVDDKGEDMPADAVTIGEIVVRGNDVMLGYYKDEAATEAASVNGWLRTGDLAVMHPDGYVEIRDRSKDIIISGGENIASVEVERVIDAHPAVVESAVVAMSDEHWGQVPVAFVTTRPGADVTADDIVRHVRERLAHFKAPRRVVFGELPKTSTGKIQKNLLRARTGEPAT